MFFALKKSSGGIKKFHSLPRETFTRFIKRICFDFPKRDSNIIEAFESESLTLWDFYNKYTI